MLTNFKISYFCLCLIVILNKLYALNKRYEYVYLVMLLFRITLFFCKHYFLNLFSLKLSFVFEISKVKSIYNQLKSLYELDDQIFFPVDKIH